MKKTVTLLIIVSAAIYGLQLLIFKDPQTTAFYILQDMAFMPFTIAIATIVVGEIMNQREKKERMEKTKMLTSSFFTELGAALMMRLYDGADCGSNINTILSAQVLKNDKSVEEMRDKIRQSKIHVTVDESLYRDVKEMILEKRTALLVISSNPLLFEHECFTDMLWEIFHLIDEFRLRGDYEDLRDTDIIHFESDMSDALKLLLLNWVSNVHYMKNTYPNFFNEALNRFGAKFAKN